MVTSDDAAPVDDAADNADPIIDGAPIVPAGHDTDGASTDTDDTSLAPTADSGEVTERIDLDRIAADLDGVEAALGRLDDGSYWTDEVTGEPIGDAVLTSDPVARRNPTGV